MDLTALVAVNLFFFFFFGTLDLTTKNSKVHEGNSGIAAVIRCSAGNIFSRRPQYFVPLRLLCG
jgi:hypothetical protein